MIDTPELLPCPFCGEQKISFNPKLGHRRASINCPACLVAMPDEAGEDELRRAWNERAAVSQPEVPTGEPEAIARIRAGVNNTSPEMDFSGFDPIEDVKFLLAAYDAQDHDGLNRQARNPVRLPDGSGDLASAGGIARDDIIDPRRQVGTPRDSAQEASGCGEDAIREAAESAAVGAQVVRSEGDLLVYYSGFNLSRFVRYLALSVPSAQSGGAA